MKPISFIDTEIDQRTKRILDIGGIKESGESFHSNRMIEFKEFLKNVEFVCGHNIFNHDLKYINKELSEAGIEEKNIIDTLFLSPLLFPKQPYHALLKDDKLQTDELNNPLNDSIKSRDLFFDEIAQFNETDDELRRIFYLLLKEQKEFAAFFRFASYSQEEQEVEKLIREKFYFNICHSSRISDFIADFPIELAYCLALINTKSRYSITPPWVLKNYPKVEQIMFQLRSKPCVTGCAYCDQALDIYKGLKEFFGFDAYRKYADEPLQERAVKAAVDNKSILAVFPTGGGKSITFQIPALMSGKSAKGLTVIISPLQSLMKDQVDNLEKIGITSAVTINGLLDPIERAKSFQRVEDGSASLLYISPESLRSKSIERLVLGRSIARFVIDEAHCFSSWGQDFRVDYLYIGDFIKNIQEKKNLEEGIPVSCFTATAKQKVIQDIKLYFLDKLSLDLEVFSSKVTRTNLHYKVFEKEGDEAKYNAARDLIEEKNCPTIIYVSRTRRAYDLAERLSKDGFSAKPYHGKMDKTEKSKNQDDFIAGQVEIMVATSAFGMGVDKKDVGLVIHYDISDSLENYIQEAGRAGRDENLSADCFVLFNEEDLSKHFILLNQTKLSIKEIQQVWKAIKDITRFRATASNSALEIARKAGWDDSVIEIETRVVTAIAALEDAGYLKRGQNMPRIFANSILSKNAQEAVDKINRSTKLGENQKVGAVRIIKKLFSSKSKKQEGEESAESRVDYISDHLGIVKEEVINIITLLREENILADAKDLTAFLKKGENLNRPLNQVTAYSKIENYLLTVFEEQEHTFHLKELNEAAELFGCKDVSPRQIKTIINFWAIKNWIKQSSTDYSRNHLIITSLQSIESLKEKLEKRHVLAKFIIELLYKKSTQNDSKGEFEKEEVLIEFSIHELKDAYTKSTDLFKLEISLDDIEDTLFYLSRIEAIKIEGGFLVVYNRLNIERLELDNKIRYKEKDFEKLNLFYLNKVQQIHIVGEYAKKMISDYKGALQFVEDYFQLNYTSFLNKYFKGSRLDEIKRNVTPGKFKQLFGELSTTQLSIITDNQTQKIAIAAGPGSGKTRVLVHKLASLLLMEDVKHEQLIMLTFSRAAASEFKKRLLKLIGNAALFIEIKTFHSYCFDLLGRVGTLEVSKDVIRKTIEKIENGEVEPSKITKTVMVIDEAQDMDADEFALVQAIMDRNEDIRVLAVGDDDQNIYEFRGASSKYLEEFITKNKATVHELLLNYRSKSNLVNFSNQFAKSLKHRLKSTPILANQPDNGNIKIIRYQSRNITTPLVKDILEADLRGTTCILTTKNEEASQIVGLLLKNKRQAKLIQSNEGYNLFDLVELRYFIEQITENGEAGIVTDWKWSESKKELCRKFENSRMLPVCKNIFKEFEILNPKRKYKSDFEAYVRESKLESFLDDDGETIFVSTIHKAKGKEFDNVCILLDGFDPSTDDKKRQLYVGLTRAKENLTIHLNGSYLDNINVENLTRTVNIEQHDPPIELAEHLTHSDVWLDYFIKRQYLVDQLQSGDLLKINGYECLNNKGQSVLKFSKQFIARIDAMNLNNYRLASVRIYAIVYWRKEDGPDEVKILLPEVKFEKVSS